MTITAFLIFSAALAQNYDPSIQKITLTIGNKQFKGFSTEFDFPAEDVRYGFWKYSRSFGHPRNQRTHYQVKIPQRSNDANMDLFLYAKTSGGKDNATFRLAVDVSAIPGDKKITYHDQAKKMIRDFKKDFYFNFYQEQIDLREKKIKKLGKKYKRLAKRRKDKKKRTRLIDKILVLEKEVKILQKKQLKLQ